MLTIASINEMMGEYQTVQTELVENQTYLLAHKSKFMSALTGWLARYEFSEETINSLFLEGFYESLAGGVYDDEFYRQQYQQSAHWYHLGLTQVESTLIVNQCRQLFFSCAEQASSPSLGYCLSHALDIGLTIMVNVYSIATIMEKMQLKFQLDVDRIKRSFEFVEGEVPHDLMQAYQDHVNWKIRTFSLALGAPQEGTFPHSTSECHLGKWLNAGGWAKIPKPYKQAFNTAHEEVHRLGAQAMQAARALRPEDIIQSLSKMEVASDKVSAILIQLIDEEIVHYAALDGLTGLPLRKAFDDDLEKNVAFAKRHKLRLGLILIDIDFFKEINDNYGHLVGDQVLKGLADVLTESIREEEMVYRWGGEEFAIMTLAELPESPKVLAERIRQAIQTHIFQAEKGQKVQVTVSCGSVCFNPAESFSIHEVFAIADQQLYRAKEMGRNRVEHQTLESK